MRTSGLKLSCIATLVNKALLNMIKTIIKSLSENDIEIAKTN